VARGGRRVATGRAAVRQLTCRTRTVILPACPRRGTCSGVPTLLIEKFSGSDAATDHVSTAHEPATSDGAATHTGDDPEPPATATPSDCTADDAQAVAAAADGETVVVSLDGEAVRLDRRAAAALRDDLTRALTRRREFLRTTGEHRGDGSYVVARRGADSVGHSKVFERFGALEALYADLPREFGADDLDCPGLTGGRRHMLVRHLAEHPAFDCDLVAEQPLTARKRGENAG
jgi:hypothetical protein